MSRPHSLSENGGLAITQSKVARPPAPSVNAGSRRVSPPSDLEVLDAVEDEVHSGNRGGREVPFLAVGFAEEGARVAAVSLHVIDGGEQHAAGAASGVVNRLALFRIEDLGHHPHHAAGGVELASLLAAGDVGELADEILIGIAEDVGRDSGIPKRD